MLINSEEERPVCGECGSRLLEVADDFWKCEFCKIYYSHNPDVLAPYRVTTLSKPTPELKDVFSRGPETEVFSLTTTQWKVITEFAKVLTLSPSMIQHYRSGLSDVFRGKFSMDDYLEKTSVETGRKVVDLIQVFIDVLGKYARRDRGAAELLKHMRSKLAEARK